MHSQLEGPRLEGRANLTLVVMVVPVLKKDKLDLRHSFAVGTLLRWYRAGIDPQSRLLQLSTFLGHVGPETTAVYLTITDQLLQEANRRFGQFARPVIQGELP